jgi:biopolymer transport protein ExbB/TolQ
METPTASNNAKFFRSMKRKSLLVNQGGAGAGVTGLVGFAGLMAVAGVFFVTENYFISSLVVSIALLIYVTGTDVGRVFLSSFTIFFSSRHLIPKAAYLQETLGALKEVLHFSRDSKGEIRAGPIQQGQAIALPDNPLVKDMQKLLNEGKGFDYAEYVAHSYHVECHELYDYTSANLEFVSMSMPIIGLMGTVLGLMSMFDNLGGDITVETLSPQLAMALKTTLYGALFSVVYKILGSRFEQRIRALDYDYETFCRGLQVLIENKARIEIEQ